MTWVVRILWVVILCAGCPRPEPALQFRMEQGVFASGRGYRFAALPDAAASVVWLEVRYSVGAADDPPDKPGLAHLVEHLLFDVEIEHRGRRSSVGAELRRLTLVHNAVTTTDFTAYVTLFNPGALNEVVEIEAERIKGGCAGLTREVFARERAVVISELKTTRLPSSVAVAQLVNEVAYADGHPYRPIGTPQSVAKLKLADVCAFLDGPYRHGEAIVVASGATDRARLAEAGRAFERVPERAPALKRSLPPIALTPDVVHHELHIPDNLVIAVWAMPPRGSLAFRALQLVWPLIPEYLGRWHPSYAARASILGGAGAPLLAVTLTLRSESESHAAIAAVKESVGFVLRFLDGLEQQSGDWHLLWEGRATAVLAEWDSLSGRSRALADYLQFEHGTDELPEQMAKLLAMQPSQAYGPARWMLGPERTHFMLLEIAFVGGLGIDADHAKRLVLEQIVHDKLFELRDRRALSYLTEASYQPRRGGGLWSLAIVVDGSRAAEAGAALVQLVEQLRNDPESYRTAFVIARQRVVERLLASSNSSRAALDELVELVRFDLDEGAFNRIATQVAALTLDTFHPFVSREFAETGQVFSAIGNRAAADAAVDAAKHARDAR